MLNHICCISSFFVTKKSGKPFQKKDNLPEMRNFFLYCKELFYNKGEEKLYKARDIIMASIKGISMQDFKEYETRRGIAYEGNLFMDEKAIGSFENSGDGGMTSTWIEKEKREEFQKRITSYFEEVPHPYPTEESFILELSSLYEDEQIFLKHNPPILFVGYKFDSFTPLEELDESVLTPTYVIFQSDAHMAKGLQERKENWKQTFVFKSKKDFEMYPMQVDEIENTKLTRDEARAYFKNLGLSYQAISEEDIQLLLSALSKELELYKNNGEEYSKQMDMKVRKPLVKDVKILKRTGLKHASLKIDGSYFEKREAITFNVDGFIGFGGELCEKNVQPILRAFHSWCDMIASKVTVA